MEERNEITEGVIWKQILLYFFPILIGYLFQQLYNTVDTIIVGKYVSSAALAAVGGTGTLINLLVGFFIGLSSGATVIIAQYYGAKNVNELNKAVHTGIALAIAGGIILTLIGLFFSPWALHMINIPDDIFDTSLLYIRIYFLGMISSMIYNVGAGILRAIGDSKSPRNYLIITCLVNIVLDIFFVLLLHLDVAGVAIATVLSQSISAILTLRKLIITSDIYKLTLSKIRFHIHILKDIMRIGLPAGGQSVLYSISNLIIQSCVNGFGTNTIAAWTSFGKIDAIVWFVMNAFGTSILTFVGQNYGAKKIDRVKKTIRVGLLMNFITIAFVQTLIYFFRDPLLSLFTNDAEVIEIGSSILKQLAPFYVGFVFNEVLSAAIKGSGEGFMPMIITVFSICLFRLLWILLVIPHTSGILWVSLSYAITWCLSSFVFILYYIYYRKKKFC